MPPSQVVTDRLPNFTVLLLREIIASRRHLVDPLNELLGLAGDLESDGWERLSPHAPLAITISLAVVCEVVTPFASLHQTLLTIRKSADHIAVARVVSLRDDFVDGVDDRADLGINLIDVGRAANRAHQALDSLHQVGGLIIEIYLSSMLAILCRDSLNLIKRLSP